jgi:hypothetical protein
MADLIIPPWMRIRGGRFDVVSNTAAAPSVFTGAVRTLARSGDKLRTTVRMENVHARESNPYKALARAIRTNLRGQANRIWLADPSYQRRGSFPTGELIANNTFASGTTSWSAYGSSTLTASDRALRASYGSNNQFGFTQASVAVTQYAPHVVRGFLGQYQLAVCDWRMDAQDSGTDYQTQITDTGLSMTAFVPRSTTVSVFGYKSATGEMMGSYFEAPYTSLSRCALIDGGANALTNSDDFSAWTQAQITTTVNATTAPDGTSTADRLVETATTNVHNASRSAIAISASAVDLMFTVAVKIGQRSHVVIGMTEATGSTRAEAYFNLTTGAVGTTSTGANWSNLRTFSLDMGNGWFQVGVIARKTNGATTASCDVGLASADGTKSFLGSTSNGMFVWRGTFTASSVAARLVATTSSAISASTQTGAGIYVKGLPASTAGLLLIGDEVQIGKQLCFVVAPLNSNSIGTGYLQLAYPVRAAAADDPVVIHEPMGRFIADASEGGWDESVGGFANFEFTLIEALDS